MYSEEARKAKIEGSVVLGVSVDEKGNLSNFRVISSLGTGLDEKAIEAVKAWKFESAYGKDGKPVATGIFVEVSFHL
ncbi:MAG: energy transducer TonB [Candidatus Sulfotelmatobacter sp.]